MELKETPASKSPDIDAGWAKVIVGASLFAAAISSGNLLTQITVNYSFCFS